MATLRDLTRLFAQLAADLRHSTASSIDSANSQQHYEASNAMISSLAASLNSKPSKSKVLDAALSLMCFTTPQVFDARIECLVRTIVSVLVSMASCDVRCFCRGDLELIRVGSSLSFRDCVELMRIGADVIENLEGHYGSSPKTVETFHTLIHAILRASVSSSNCQTFVLSASNTEENERIKVERRTLIAKLICFLPCEDSVGRDKIPLRLHLWYLDPVILKHDLSEIARETTERPFICLKKELHDRKSWCSVVICLVTSPSMFKEARQLMHSWFLLTGLASVLNLQIALISSVLDVLSRPMWWGVLMEMGLRFPMSHAYFQLEHHELLAVLTGPISCESFLDLVLHIRTAAIKPSNNSIQNDIHPTYGKFGHCEVINAVDNNSTWSMLMAFPAWFYFATILVFHGKYSQDSCLSDAVFSTSESGTRNFEDLHKAAAFYLSWVIDPRNETSINLLADRIEETSRSWSMKSQSNFSLEKKSHSGRSKLRISKVNDCEKLHLEAADDGVSEVAVWLKKFDGSCVNVCNRVSISQISITEAKDEHNSNVHPNLLLLRIPLGILITSSYLDQGCELLLDYATTGGLLQSREIQRNTLDCLSAKGRIWPADGACLIFNLFDILEDMSVMLFVCEDTRANFICRMKGKVSGYLLWCIKALLEPPAEQSQIDEVAERVMVDLYRRLTHWMQQGQEGFEGCLALNEVVDDYARRFSIAKENQEH